jgi:hypothetical protein
VNLESIALPLRVAILVLTAFLLNIPFGAWRARTRKFSVAWAVAIHGPIPMIIPIRLLLGLSYWFIIGSVVFAIAGQLVGGRLFKPATRE